MMERQIINCLLISMIIFAGCYYDSEETLYPASDSVTTDMSYQYNIVPLLSQNCYSCHSVTLHTGDVTLEGYTNLLTYVNDGRLLGAIKHQSGFEPMPQLAPKLPTCEIAKVEHWITDGALNN